MYGEDEADGEGVEEYGLEELKVRCDGIAEAPMNRLDVFCMVRTEGVWRGVWRGVEGGWRMHSRRRRWIGCVKGEVV